MTPDDLMTLKKEINAMSAYYQLKLEGPIIAMYAEDLSDLDIDAVISAYRSWRKNPKNFRFPLPSQIRNIVCPEVNPEDQARDAAARIVSALSKFGYTNPNEARQYIGELGWRVVERQGGWVTICERTMRDEIPTYQSQWAKQALAVVHLIQSGHDEPPSLPPRSVGSLSSKDIQKLLDKSKSVDDAITPEEPKGLYKDGSGAA